MQLKCLTCENNQTAQSANVYCSNCGNRTWTVLTNDHEETYMDWTKSDLEHEIKARVNNETLTLDVSLSSLNKQQMADILEENDLETEPSEE